MPKALPGQQVGKPGILGQNRTMQVGAVDLPIARAFATILAIIAAAGDHSAKWLRVLAKIGPPAMILEADQALWSARRKVAFHSQMIHKSGIATLSIDIQSTYTL